ncbi:MAG: thioredoxin domain-containing protein [Cryobacterium sp.]|nr:thioredoxin domain-containing protein [Oligoflexia bacterium]
MVFFAGCTDSQAKPAKPNIVTKDGTKPGIVAKIGEVEVTEDELIGEARSDIYELHKREYDLKMDRLNKLMEDKLIGAEAKKANLPTEKFISEKIVGKLTVSDSEFKAFVKEKKIPEDQLKEHPEYKQRITGYLENQKRQEKVQKYLADLTKKTPIEVYFKKPTMERVQIELGDSPMLGKKDAKVTIVEFSDFQCPYCSRGAETMHAVVKKYGSKVNLVFKNYPLPFHERALPAAEMGLCVKKLGNDDKFWKFHDLAFKNQDKLDADSLVKYAKEAGVNDAKAKECLEKGENKAAVTKDTEYGNKVGVRSTPTFFVNGQMVAGALPIEQFSDMIDEELEAKK